MLQIELQIGVEGYASEKDFREFCQRYNCTLAPKEEGDTYWTISSDDPMNFYWLGANMTFITGPLKKG